MGHNKFVKDMFDTWQVYFLYIQVVFIILTYFFIVYCVLHYIFNAQH